MVRLLLCLAVFLLAGAAPSRADEPVDLLLVLAVDASGSVDDGEYSLQLGGIATALRDSEVHAAIAAGPLGRIAVNLVIWSEADQPKDTTGWHRIDGPEAAQRLADLIENHPRRVVRGGTGIGKALQFATWEIERSGFETARRVIDLSGDGSETALRDGSQDLQHGRGLALLRGITVNGLAILQDEPDLDDYYRENVVGGPGAFVEVAEGYAAFTAAMQRKLLREVQGLPLIGCASCGGVPGTAW